MSYTMIERMKADYAANTSRLSKLQKQRAELDKQVSAIQETMSALPFGYPKAEYSGKIGAITRKIKLNTRTNEALRLENESIMKFI